MKVQEIIFHEHKKVFNGFNIRANFSKYYYYSLSGYQALPRKVIIKNVEVILNLILREIRQKIFLSLFSSLLEVRTVVRPGQQEASISSTMTVTTTTLLVIIMCLQSSHSYRLFGSPGSWETSFADSLGDTQLRVPSSDQMVFQYF